MVKRNELVVEAHVLAAVELVTPIDHPFHIVFVEGSFRDRFVRQRFQRAIRVGAERDALPSLGPVPEREHLLACQHDAHRALKVQRSHHSQH